MHRYQLECVEMCQNMWKRPGMCVGEQCTSVGHSKGHGASEGQGCEQDTCAEGEVQAGQGVGMAWMAQMNATRCDGV